MMRTLSGKSLSWLLAYIYFSSYVTRINFGAVIQQVVTDTGYAKSALSGVLVCLSVSYGIGQIINGRIGDKIRPQNLIFIGLITAMAANLMFPLASKSLLLMSILWTVNGFAQAMMWPPMVRIMVGAMDEITYDFSVVLVNLGASCGTIAVYLISPLIIKLFNWESVFFVSAAIGIASVILWAATKNRIPEETGAITHVSVSGKFKFPKAALFPFVLMAFAIVFMGMLRDGVTSWMPTFLAESFKLTNNISILCTVSLAVCSAFTFVIAGAFYKRFFKNEVACAAVIFGLGAVSCGVLLVFFDFGAVLSVVCMTLITAAMHGVNLMLITHSPKRFKAYGNISTMSGIINSFTYLGAAIATYGIARLSELFGWRATVGIWLGIAALGTLCCVIAMPKWKKFIEKGA